MEFYNKSIDEEIKKSYEDGRKDERERIAAWLLVGCARVPEYETQDAFAYGDILAERIRNGEHETGDEP